MVDGLLDHGQDSRWLAEQVEQFTPLLLGITDEYAVAGFHGERDDLRLDAGLFDWEVADLDVVAGPQAVTEVAGMPAEVVVIALTGDLGESAARVARQGAAELVLTATELPTVDEQGLEARLVSTLGSA